FAQSAPLDLWTEQVMAKIRDRRTLDVEIIPRVGYFEVFYNAEVGDADWADSHPPYAVHRGDTIRIHAYLSSPLVGGPNPGLVTASLSQWASPSVAAEREAPTRGIAGIVKDEAGHPLAGAWVTAVNTTTSSRPRETVVTDESGHYVIPNLPGLGPYEIRIRVYGYADRWVKNVSAGAVVDIEYGTQDRLGSKEAAAQYPAQYWVSLLDSPSDSKVKAAGFADQRAWMA